MYMQDVLTRCHDHNLHTTQAGLEHAVFEFNGRKLVAVTTDPCMGLLVNIAMPIGTDTHGQTLRHPKLVQLWVRHHLLSNPSKVGALHTYLAGL